MVTDAPPLWRSGLERVLVLPHDVHHLLRALVDDDLDYPALAKVLAYHPTICARLLALANSAWANGHGEAVTSIERCCLKLGMNVVRAVGIGLAVMKPFYPGKCREFDLRRYWVSGMLTGQAAAQLAEPLGGRLAQTVRTAGILHNIGILCLADTMPEQTQAVLEYKRRHPEIALSRLLRQALDCDYCEVGGYLAEHWGLAPELVAAIAQHGEPEYRGCHWQSAQTVHAAARMACRAGKDEEWPPLSGLSEIGISAERQAEVYRRLGEQAPTVRELAATLFH
ncbi:HDOD domain-containing protein [Methylomonas sp. MS20]|uniref:HDOD domain-containing protein n=1 Tax=unclassified Methylomonas TaxID=2608980 RepID=UPI0028A34B22|nr:HDOD domain-containing protein [Methylomonas sp. MV1]MDT4331492.1 HDOD domain-containing protein [Methylomonas sp. MV1]